MKWMTLFPSIQRLLCTGSSSPVVWVKKPGTYRCTVRDSGDPSSRECSSAEINLKGMCMRKCDLAHYPPHSPFPSHWRTFGLAFFYYSV